ncbi:MAG TPA: glycosyltransferase [Candidatus Cybelea sp.]|nr:glycosyltransferase [Candidatus Cybelea sp.]
MRVLKIVQSYSPFEERGGTVFKVRAIAGALVRRGHQITVLTADLGIARRAKPGAQFERCEWGWQQTEDGVNGVFLPTIARYRALTINPRVVAFCRASLRRFDVVHVYGVYDLLGPVVGYFCRREGIPYVLEPMGMYQPIIRNLALKKVYRRFFGRRLADGARFLIATSEQEREELAGAGVETARIVVRRNGVDQPDDVPARGEFRRRWKIPDEAKVILFLGRVISKKRPDLLLEAFAGWRGGILVIAGPDEGDGFLPRLKSAAVRLGVAQNVIFTGPLYGEEKWRAYRDADVFVLPSENENFGNTAGESAACGTPVIVTDSCGIAPLVRDAGLVVRPEKEELRDALGRVLDDAVFRNHCQSGCSEMAKRLSWDRPIEECERLYEACLPGHAARELVSEEAARSGPSMSTSG